MAQITFAKIINNGRNFLYAYIFFDIHNYCNVIIEMGKNWPINRIYQKHSNDITWQDSLIECVTLFYKIFEKKMQKHIFL
jgi:hypothetical protein